jgi:intracellular septation protein A
LPVEHQFVGPIELPSLRALAARAVPQVVEGVVVPAALFLVVKSLAGLAAAIVAAFGWWVVVIASRLVRRQRVPAIVLVGALTLFVRSVVGLATGSTVLYFLQPSVAPACLAAAFLGSVVCRRPLARRFAGDFCTLPRAVLHDLRVHRFFQRVSIMWAIVGLANAALTLWLLVTVSTSAFVAAQAALSVSVTVTAVGVSFLWFRSSLTRHGMAVRVLRPLPVADPG